MSEHLIKEFDAVVDCLQCAFLLCHLLCSCLVLKKTKESINISFDMTYLLYHRYSVSAMCKLLFLVLLCICTSYCICVCPGRGIFLRFFHPPHFFPRNMASFSSLKSRVRGRGCRSLYSLYSPLRRCDCDFGLHKSKPVVKENCCNLWTKKLHPSFHRHGG